MQVLTQLKQHLHLGRLRSGDRLPSVRQLARILDVNPKTAHSIYHYLEYEGLVEIRPRSGVFVSGGNVAKEQSREAELARKVRRLIREAYSLGFTQDELSDLFKQFLESSRPPDLLGVVECNEDFRRLICGDLTRELHVNIVPISPADLKDWTSPSLAGLRHLVTTEYHLRELQNIVRGTDLGKAVYAVRLNYKIFEELEARLSEGRVLFLVKETCFIDELGSLLKEVLSPSESVNFVGVTYDNQFLVSHWLKRVRFVYISPTCPYSLRKWINRNKPDEVVVRQLTGVVCTKSLKELKDVLFCASGLISQGSLSHYAVG